MKMMIPILLLAVMLSIFTGCDQTSRVQDESSNGLARVDITQKCYIIDETAHKILRETTFTVEGWLNEDGVIDGTMNVEAYPVVPDALRKYDAVSLDISLDGFKIYTCQILRLLDPECDTFYNAYISTSNPQIGIVHIFHNGEMLTAVFAENEDVVWQNYNKYLELRRQ